MSLNRKILHDVRNIFNICCIIFILVCLHLLEDIPEYGGKSVSCFPSIGSGHRSSCTIDVRIKGDMACCGAFGKLRMLCMKRLPYFGIHFIMAVVALLLWHHLQTSPFEHGNVFALVAVICAIVINIFTFLWRMNDIGLTGWSKFWAFILHYVPVIGFFVGVWSFVASSDCRLRGKWL